MRSLDSGTPVTVFAICLSDSPRTYLLERSSRFHARSMSLPMTLSQNSRAAPSKNIFMWRLLSLAEYPRGIFSRFLLAAKNYCTTPLRTNDPHRSAPKAAFQLDFCYREANVKLDIASSHKLCVTHVEPPFQFDVS